MSVSQRLSSTIKMGIALMFVGVGLGTTAFVQTPSNAASEFAVLDAGLASNTPTSTSVTPAANDNCQITASTNMAATKGFTVTKLSYTGSGVCSETTPAIYLQANLQWCPLTSNCDENSSWITEVPQPSEIVSYGIENILPTYLYFDPSPGDWRELLNWRIIAPGGTEAQGAEPSNIVYAPY